jgi:hypothetical protein
MRIHFSTLSKALDSVCALPHRIGPSVPCTATFGAAATPSTGMTFDECYDKCKKVADRSNDQSFDACKR